MPHQAAITALIAAAAGWYYLFYSQAVRRLDGIESSTANNNRRRLRRMNGIALLAIGMLFYTGFAIEPRDHPKTFLAIWVTVLALLIVIVVLAAADMRLTARLRRKQK